MRYILQSIPLNSYSSKPRRSTTSVAAGSGTIIAQSSFQAAALSTATEHFQKALALDDLERARIACSSTGADIGVHILNYFSRTLAVLGLPHQATMRRDEL